MSRKNQEGALLIELCIVMSVLLVLFAMSAPSFLAMRRTQQQTAAVELMKRVSKAELYHAQIYSDGYRSPAALSAPVTFPKTCEGSGLLSGMDAFSQYAGYQFNFLLGPVQAPLGVGCTWQGSTTYTLTATPQDPINPRSFYLNETGVVRFSDDPTSPANAASPAWIY
jgi:Tfp pilus assembly protein PilE